MKEFLRTEIYLFAFNFFNHIYYDQLYKMFRKNTG
jgi:hypothetical protein